MTIDTSLRCTVQVSRHASAQEEQTQLDYMQVRPMREGMETIELPVCLKAIQLSLQPYVKNRQETTRIRRVLTIHQTEQNNQTSIPATLSLLEATQEVGSSPSDSHGIRKEYYRRARSNLKAKNEYLRLKQAHRPSYNETSGSRSEKSTDGMSAFLDSTKARQKLARLSIIQRYVDTLDQRPGADADCVDQKLALPTKDPPPKLCREVLNTANTQRISGEDDLQDVVEQLEKSILRAKMALKKEQSLRSKSHAFDASSARGSGKKLEALGTTRNALIMWMEHELSKSPEDTHLQSQYPQHHPSVKTQLGTFNNQIASIQTQYVSYIKSRKALIGAVNGALAIPSAVDARQENNEFSARNKQKSNNAPLSTTIPFLFELSSISNEQKAIIQQRSHITVTLAKQIKETSRGLHRLVEESHLLPTYRMPSNSKQRNVIGYTTSFGDEMSSHETPNSSHQAHAWVYAARSASESTRGALSERLEEGGEALLEAQANLMELLVLFGGDGDVDEEAAKQSGGGASSAGDIWNVLDGNLGVI